MQLTRRFSEAMIEREPESPLVRGLCSTFIEDDNDAQKPQNAQQLMGEIMAGSYYSLERISPTDREMVESEYNKLMGSFEKLQKKHGTKLKLGKDSALPDLSVILEGATEQQQRLKEKSSSTKVGKAQGKLRSLCRGIRSHSNIAKVLPKDDKYICLFTGSVFTFIEAVGNYDDLNEEIEMILDDIVDDLEYWRNKLPFVTNERMFTYVAKLYVLYFQFLAQIFDMWSASSSTRFWTSLDQSALNRLQKSREKIERAQNKLDRAARDGEVAKAQSGLDMLVREMKDMREENKALHEMVLSVGQQSRKLLVESNLKQEVLDNFIKPSPRLLQHIKEDPPTSSLELQAAVRPMNSATIATNTAVAATDAGNVIDVHEGMHAPRADLERHLHNINNLLGRISSLEIDRDVRTHITKLLDSSTDHILWVEGPTNTVLPSQNTTTAAVLASIAARQGVPCVKYFNSVSIIQNRYDGPNRHRRLQDLGISLIMQLIAIVPESRLAEVTVLQQNINAVGQRSIPIDECLALLVALRAAIPSQLIILLDYCQVLETSGDREYSQTLYRLFETICRLGHTPSQATVSREDKSLGVNVTKNNEQESTAGSSTSGSTMKSHATKVCFTTDGYMNTLAVLRKKNALRWIAYDNEADELGCDDTDTFE